jgi:hypothetical protein
LKSLNNSRLNTFDLTLADLLSAPGGASISDKFQAVKPKPEDKTSVKIEEEVKENQAPLEKVRTPGREGKFLPSQVNFESSLRITHLVLRILLN